MIIRQRLNRIFDRRLVSTSLGIDSPSLNCGCKEGALFCAPKHVLVSEQVANNRIPRHVIECEVTHDDEETADSPEISFLNGAVRDMTR